MSFSVEYQANNGQLETIVFGNEAAANRFASTKKLAVVTPVEVEAPDAAVKQLAPRGKARPPAKRRAKKPATPRVAAERTAPVASGGFSSALADFLRERLAKKEEKAA